MIKGQVFVAEHNDHPFLLRYESRDELEIMAYHYFSRVAYMYVEPKQIKHIYKVDTEEEEIEKHYLTQFFSFTHSSPPNFFHLSVQGFIDLDGNFWRCKHEGHSFLARWLVAKLYGRVDRDAETFLEEEGYIRVSMYGTLYRGEPTDEQVVTLYKLRDDANKTAEKLKDFARRNDEMSVLWDRTF